MKRIAALTVLLVMTLSACTRMDRGRTGAGHLEMRWTGTDQGRVAGPATAEWCALSRLLEIRAVLGDTGVAVAIYPAETLAAGSYRVMNPVKAESLPPSAGLALRWPGQSYIRGFRGESGSLVLERSPSGELSGKVTAAARSATDTGLIQVTGGFRDLAVRASTRGCGAPPPSADTLDASVGDTLVD